MTRGPEPGWRVNDLLHMEVSHYLRRTQGRETFGCGPLPGFPDGCIVKRTRPASTRAVWIQPWVRGAARTAGRREHQNLVALAAIGLSVPRAIAWSSARAPLGSASVVVMERVRHRLTLREELERSDARQRARRGVELLQMVVRLHAAGFHHRDLYLQHFLVRASDEALVLIDVGRVRRGRGARWLVKDLAALLHSTPARVTARERLRFLAGWFDAQGIVGRATRRRWLRAVEAKRARIAAHVPRDERAPAR